METLNTTTVYPETAAEKVLRLGSDTVERLFDEVEDGCRAYGRSRLASVLPPSDVVWDLVAAVAFASGGAVTNGHPFISVIAAGVVPLAIHVIRALAAAFLSLEAVRVLRRLFH